MAATCAPLKALTLNASGDGYYNQIDASNLGFSTHRSTWAWSGKMSADYALSKKTVFQLDWRYQAKRLTPQGYRVPTFGSNAGVRHESKPNLGGVLAVSDLFNSMKEETVLNTPALRDDSVRRRNSRFVYAGLIYSLGGKKKGKADALQFEN